MVRYRSIIIGEIHKKHFTSQKDMAEFLCIVNSSKKSIESRCRVLGYKVEFD